MWCGEKEFATSATLPSFFMDLNNEKFAWHDTTSDINFEKVFQDAVEIMNDPRVDIWTPGLSSDDASQLMNAVMSISHGYNDRIYPIPYR